MTIYRLVKDVEAHAAKTRHLSETRRKTMFDVHRLNISKSRAGVHFTPGVVPQNRTLAKPALGKVCNWCWPFDCGCVL